MARFRHDQEEDDAAPAQVSAALMCSAHGCPNRWSSDPGRLCRWHAVADPARWPEITQRLQWDETERAQIRSEPKPYVEPLTVEDKRAILAKMLTLSARMRDKPPKAWAERLRRAEERGRKLSEIQRGAWREALGGFAVQVGE